MAARRKVYVTGMGAVCCLGASVGEFWQAVLNGSCGLRGIERFDVEGSPYTIAGEVTGFAPVPFREAGASMGAQFAARAALEAVADLPAELRAGMAVVLSTNFGPSEVIGALLEGETVALRRDDGRAWTLRDGPFAWDVDCVARAVGAGGERATVSLSCSSGNAAIAHALTLIRSGSADLALAGGYDSIQKVVWAGLSALRVMALGGDGGAQRVRPFDKNRSGTIFSEGAGVLLLESEAHARRRDAEPLAEVAGAGTNNNAYHMTHPDKEGRATAEAIQMALGDAGIVPGAVDHFNAHGTGTRLNDAVEAAALRMVLGPRAAEIPVTSLKGGLGHAMGASSALEAIACVMTLKEGLVPPTLHYETPDPECDLNLVAGAPLEREITRVVNNSAGIGGCNAAVVLRKVQ